MTVMGAVVLVPLKYAVIVSCRVVVVELVDMVKVAESAPAGTVTDVGTKATVPVVHRSILRPPAGAAAVKVTVPVADTPLLTLCGLTETEASVPAAVTVTPAVLVAAL